MHSTTIKAPSVPRNLDDTGLTLVMMRDILLKTMYRMNLSRISEIARTICLPIPQAIELIDQCRHGKLLEAVASVTASTSSEASFQLTEAGKARAMDALSQSEYYGAMPVPLDRYAEQVKQQSIRNVQITRRQLQIAMGDLILPPTLLSDLGPAVSSGRSILMYGPPGNGKSSISNGIRAAMGDRIYVPRAITHAGQVISVYDPIVHTIVDTWEDDPNLLRQTGNRFDSRYVYCERPTVITGGELTLSMLDLTFNPVSRTYQAPLQFKATGGVFIIDDLGAPRRATSIHREPLDRADGNELRYSFNAIGREIRGAVRHTGDLLDEFSPERDFRPKPRCAGFSTRSRSTGQANKIS